MLCTCEYPLPLKIIVNQKYEKEFQFMMKRLDFNYKLYDMVRD
jgi:hypothetical protein